MSSRYRAIARSGPIDDPQGDVFPLAGSAHVWFDHVQRQSDNDKAAILRADALAETDRARLTNLRDDLCGLTLDRPRIMGIVNVTPDSFSDGGDRLAVADALAAVHGMVDADVLDIGGESTRPGADFVPDDVEIARVVPVISAIREAGINTPISIDTRKAAVAAAALDAGADIVNDVSAMAFDAAMAGLVAERDVPVCLMHTQGDPATMHLGPRYDDVVSEVFDQLAERIEFAVAAGVKRGRIIADPGIGFGKTLQHNVTLLRELALYHDLGVPILLGASRKRMIGTIGKAPEAKDRVPGSLAVALHGAALGTQILRVHDVRETRQALNLHLALSKGKWDDT